MARPQKRSIVISGHRTSVSLEAEFWQALREIATARGISVTALLAEIDASRDDTGLSSAARVYALRYFSQLLGSSENSRS